MNINFIDELTFEVSVVCSRHFDTVEYMVGRSVERVGYDYAVYLENRGMMIDITSMLTPSQRAHVASEVERYYAGIDERKDDDCD